MHGGGVLICNEQPWTHTFPAVQQFRRKSATLTTPPPKRFSVSPLPGGRRRSSVLPLWAASLCWSVLELGRWCLSPGRVLRVCDRACSLLLSLCAAHGGW